MRRQFAWWCALFVVAVGIVFAEASDVAGKWRGTAATGTDIALDLKVDAGTVTGTVSLNRAKAEPISNGKFDDGRLSFTMPSMFGHGTVTVNGKLDGEELALNLESERGATTARLKRE